MQHFTAPQLKTYLDQAGDNAPLLIDVREPWEYDIVHIQDSRLVPLDRLGSLVEDIPPDRELVMICHHGIRSRQAGMLLERQGFTRVINLTGGIDAWSRQVDPSLPCY
ncbi:rhodanese-like domain-containing protein [Ectothiorhodospira lacustris]|uniref:rhodanese-like domain-containing protein n=1 Tax=Ectothiorhodospira lacustris TaxID=2899127 RepID=UPI001EE8B5AB|nr:rhodanese-like domain-containing protein [Ectothiorhodospira lacustris]MCG5500689.1 sulfurtransferase [Ectothiorhodospira lacustris]MCG5509925.1 sulfurtransferase [Ectothiorhodospira lacustris]MCG5521179.1 sulfurtransferase [Ectothiorhodospira lacustris]